jgi:ABC-2 type transport system permease protein
MSDKKFKSKNPAFVIMKRELKSYFSGPIGYIITALFLVINGLLFFAAFFLQNRADLRNFFSMLPILLSFFIPAIAMRVLAEEKRVGSIETLMTLPVREIDVVTGKYLAILIEALVMLAPTLFYVITAEIFGSPDYGPIIGGFVGAIFLCASFTAIGLFATSVTKNQIIAFFTGFIICIALAMIDSFLIFLPSSIVSVLSYLSASAHFTSISRGILDTRDVIYFVSLTALFFTATVKLQQSAKN